MKISIGLIVIFSFFALHLNAQLKSNCRELNIDSLYQANLEIRIPVNTLLGKWITNDSLPYGIEFIDEGSMVTIEPKVHMNPYSFFKENDSVPASGYAMNWPPYFFTMNLLDETTIEIYFFGFTREHTTCYTFRKK